MALEITVTHGGGKKVDAHVSGFTIHTDQPVSGGGEASAPDPFTTFLSSLAACAGIYVVGFCQTRSIPLDGIRLVQEHTFDPETGKLAGIDLRVEVPASFPEKYRDAVARAASQCAVKRVLENPPQMKVTTSVLG